MGQRDSLRTDCHKVSYVLFTEIRPSVKMSVKIGQKQDTTQKKTYRIAITDLSEAKDTVDDLNITTEHDEHLVVSEISTTIDCKYAVQICRNLIVW